jgi:hypothetical protein
MMTDPLPENWEDLIAGYALGNLSDEEAANLEWLLARHPELQLEVERCAKTTVLLARAVPQPTAPLQLRQKLMAAATRQSEIRPLPIQPRSAFPWRVAIGSAAAIVLLALGADNLRLRQQLVVAEQSLTEAQRELREQQATIASLQQRDSAFFQLTGKGDLAAAGSAVFPPSSQEVIVSVRDLPPAPEGEIYRIWAFLENRPEPIFCGQFTTNPDGAITKSWKTPPAIANATVSQLVITTEPIDAPRRPQGTAVMQSIL